MRTILIGIVCLR